MHMNYIQYDWWSEKETAVKTYTPTIRRQVF